MVNFEFFIQFPSEKNYNEAIAQMGYQTVICIERPVAAINPTRS